VRRYFFVTTGDLSRNASFVRLRELGRELAILGLDVHYVVDPTEFNRELAASLPYATAHVLKASNRLAQIRERRRCVWKVAPDIVHILNPQPSNCAAILAWRGAVVVDFDELLSQRFGSAPRRAISSLCEFYGKRRATVLVVASRHQERYFRDHGRADAVYLPYACYLPVLPDGPNPYSVPTAVYLGNFHPDFDHDLIVDAWRVLREQGVPPNLELIGSGVDLDKVRHKIADGCLSNCISLPGYMTGQALWDRLRHSHVLLFPIRDTVGNRMRCPSKTFAYMQAGRPIITNRVGEVAEALGDKAIYVEPTAAGFADAVNEAFKAPPQTVDYNLDAHSWAARAQILLDAVARHSRAQSGNSAA
jgi:glycosyltransferase involved in cell wall biosynthesis